jgi:Ser/Thr protein kinase RdoA (MazF antagonist)
MTMNRTTLERIAKQFPVGAVSGIRRLGGGITNDTYLVRAGTGPFVLQRLHGVFKPEVLADTDAVTARLALRGMTTPRLVRTRDDALGHMHESGCWRMLTFVPGRCLRESLDAVQVRSAAALLGSFHRHLDGMEYRFAHRLEHFHDTARKMTDLELALAECRRDAAYAALEPLGSFILAEYRRLEPLNGLTPRIIHGDPKAANIRFDRAGRRAVALLDLDTVGRNAVAVELGDAARSWCNRAPEGDWRRARFNLANFAALMDGYVRAADGTVGRDELSLVPLGAATITLELAARFVTDAFRRAYFKLERDRYRDLGEQNAVRARSQVRLYRDLSSKFGALVRIAHSA